MLLFPSRVFLMVEPKKGLAGVSFTIQSISGLAYTFRLQPLLLLIFLLPPKVDLLQNSNNSFDIRSPTRFIDHVSKIYSCRPPYFGIGTDPFISVPIFSTRHSPYGEAHKKAQRVTPRVSEKKTSHKESP